MRRHEHLIIVVIALVALSVLLLARVLGGV
jgi:hypothetical protein